MSDRFEFHQFADIFPLLNESELQALTDDIKFNGLRQPIVLYKGKILDGRNRYKACQLARIEPKTVEYSGESPLAFVVSVNLRRRHLNESQRAMIAAKLETLKHGGRREGQDANWHLDLESKNKALLPADKPEAVSPVSRSDAASMLNVSERSVARAKTVTEAAVPEVITAVESGKIPVSVAAVIAEAEPEQQREVIAKDDKKAILAAAREIQKEKTQERREKVLTAIAEKLPQSGSHVDIFNTDKEYRVVYADPPWDYGNKQQGTGTGVQDHYPDMPLDEICKLPVKDITEQNAVLFLWVTSPQLDVAFDVIRDWGFKYKSSFVWDKVAHNMGHYNSVRHEFLLIATRGSCKPDEQKLFDSVQSIERTEHSVKPQEFRDIIDTLYPLGNRIELFARRESTGWDIWGNEI